MNRHRPHASNLQAQGFSLLEVILALSILAGAIVVLGELVRLGTLNAASARDLTQAQLLCETKLAEVMSGLMLPEIVQSVPCETDAGFLYSIDVQPLDMPGLLVLTVTVTQNVPATHHPAQFTLVRWIQDPATIIPEEVPLDAATPTGSSTSGTQSSGGTL
jgi:prepilin-type N-terminal cleavage/methylation domain-containing protein